jgi:hypothetical protein
MAAKRKPKRKVPPSRIPAKKARTSAKVSRQHDPVEAERNLDRLGHQMLRDLDLESGGIHWLLADTATRILVSDQLVGTLETLGQNLTACEHHLRGFEAANNRLDSITLREWKRDLKKGIRPSVIAAPSQARDTLLCDRDSHIAGFFRAEGSVFDNTATAIAILAALPVDIVRRFTWGSLRRAFDKVVGSEEPAVAQTGLWHRIEELITDSGPPGWLDWTVSMRNMLVHRPRRIWMARPVFTPSMGNPQSLRTSLMLPKDPDLSTVEVMRDAVGFSASLLTEDASGTMTGVFDSTKRFTEAVCAELHSFAQRRRTQPELLRQPVEQWRGRSIIPEIGGPRFDGYHPHSVESLGEEDVMSSHEALVLRMQAAFVLDGAQRSSWPAWLAEAQQARK